MCYTKYKSHSERWEKADVTKDETVLNVVFLYGKSEIQGRYRRMISTRIFALMQEKGISQKELAEKTGISPSTISDWKRKKTNPSADKLKAICDVLGMNLYDLLGEQDSRRPVDYVIVNKDSEDYLLLETYHALPEVYRERVTGYLQALRDLETMQS